MSVKYLLPANTANLSLRVLERQKQYLSHAPEWGVGQVLFCRAPWRGLRERSWFNALLNSGFRMPAFDKLQRLPDYRLLKERICADNPLIALAVTKREVSWTKFQHWLMDPLRHNNGIDRHFAGALLEQAVQTISKKRLDGLNAEHLARLQTLSPFTNVIVRSARAEISEGKTGRSDLVLECDVDDCRIEVVVENKIEAKESTDQLAEYVAEHEKGLAAGTMLLPMLIELGDDAVGSSSCPWAVCWGRRDADAWLHAGSCSIRQSGLPVPSLVDSYRNLFESWDIAMRLRREGRRLIEHVEKSDSLPAEWALVKDWLAVGDRLFFDEVLLDPRLVEILDKHGLDKRTTEGAIRGRNETLKITKAAWTMPSSVPDDGAVNVHFESRDRGMMLLDVEIAPYRGSIEKDPDLLRRLAAELSKKAELHRQLRAAIDKLPDVHGRYGVTRKGRRSADKPSTCTCVKFDCGLGTECTLAEHAVFAARVVDAVAPMVDRLTQLTATRGTP